MRASILILAIVNILILLPFNLLGFFVGLAVTGFNSGLHQSKKLIDYINTKLNE